MLITLELLLCDDLRHSMMTLGDLLIEQKPALENAVSDYAGLYATTPPGVWVRSYQSVPALPFFDFLAGWRHVQDVHLFLDANFRYVSARMSIPEGRANV
ncbi:hypothetical protein DPU24_25580 [Salmonella enterica subsp. enterica serovar Oranienburg]|nr:hypothetical protein [Salmonella enterica subsp. enterica serovar Oranienburg]HAK8204839.1 hypothetical protein [Salmonella enterica]